MWGWQFDGREWHEHSHQTERHWCFKVCFDSNPPTRLKTSERLKRHHPPSMRLHTTAKSCIKNTNKQTPSPAIQHFGLFQECWAVFFWLKCILSVTEYTSAVLQCLQSWRKVRKNAVLPSANERLCIAAQSFGSTVRRQQVWTIERSINDSSPTVSQDTNVSTWISMHRQTVPGPLVNSKTWKGNKCVSARSLYLGWFQLEVNRTDNHFP